MKLTKTQLKQIIKEEMQTTLNEGWVDQVAGFFGKMSPEDQEVINDFVQGIAAVTADDLYMNVFARGTRVQQIEDVGDAWIEDAKRVLTATNKVQRKAWQDLAKKGTPAGRRLYEKLKPEVDSFIAAFYAATRAFEASDDEVFRAEMKKVYSKGTFPLRDQFGELGSRVRPVAAGIEKKRETARVAANDAENIQHTKEILYMIADRAFPDEDWQDLSAFQRSKVFRRYENWTDSGRKYEYGADWKKVLRRGAHQIPDEDALKAQDQSAKSGGGWAAKFAAAARRSKKESISRKKLERIIKEELKRFLRNK